MKTPVNNVSIQKKLLIIIVVGVIIPILTLFFLLWNQLYSSYISREMILADESISRVESNVTKVLDDTYYLTATFLADFSLNWKLRSQTSLSSYEQIKILSEVQDSINAHIYGNNAVDDIIIYHNNPDLNLELNVKPYVYDDLTEELKAFLNGEDSYFIQSDGSAFVFYRILNPFLSKNVNYMELHITDSTVRDALKDNWISNRNGDVYFVDNNHRIMYSVSPGQSPDGEIQYMEDIQRDDRHWYLEREFSYGDYLTDFTLMVVLEKPNYLSTQKNEFQQLILILTLTLIFAVIIIKILGGNINRRLIIINNAMDSWDEDQLAYLEKDMGSDEIGETGRKYNYLAQRINDLFNEKSKAYKDLEEINREYVKANQELETSYEEIKDQELRIKELIYVDKLTGLMNKFAIDEAIKEALEGNDTSEPMAIVFLDIDNFKNINDIHGHDVGDRVIEQTGNRLESFAKDGIVIGRFGGDEFLMLIRHQSIESLEKTVLGIQEAFNEPIFTEQQRFYLTVSMGISIFPVHGKDKNGLIQAADLALYKAKDSGRNKYVIYEDHMGEMIDEKIRFQDLVKQAFYNGEFYMNYQPYVDIASDRVIGYEALIRWKSPVLGQVSPYKLITSAEEMGLIIELGEWILKEACTFAREINEISDTPVSVSINVSAVQIMDPDFYDKVMKVIEKVDVSPQVLCFEMTETILIDSIEKRSEILDTLRSHGIRISIDDFGTGYSSLKYFKDLPADYLKIDKAFIDEISKKGYEMDLIHIMISIAHKRDMKVIAEGVEAEAQVKCLRTEGCDIIQGYYYGKPVGKEAALKGMMQR